MHKNIAVKLHNISKVYKLYHKPVDRLKESLHPLKKRYHKEFNALKNINLEIKKGEVLGIVGVNGAGKSTLLKIIAGVLTPTSGRITINGKINAILELSTGLKGEMTGRQNIKLNLQINGIEENTKQITQEIIDFADIGEHIDQPVKTYSSGMKARLGFGLATSTNPDILIVDEVLAVGDVLFRRKCYNRIENLFKNGKTVIFVSHDTQSVIKFCSRAILLYDREIILEDSPKKVTDYYQKLLFSKDHKQTLDEIKDEHPTADQVDKKATTKILSNNSYTQNTEVKKSFYIKDFLSNTLSEISNFDVDIYDYALYTIDGEKVNHIYIPNDYTIRIKIKFNAKFNDVRIGFNIKTETGLAIGGALIFEKDIVEISENFNLEKQFYCNFKPGNYYITLTVQSTINEEKTILKRINDAFVFKILEWPSNDFWGLEYIEPRSKQLVNTHSNVYKSFFNKNKCIFIHIPKVAGISIEQTLFKEKVGHQKVNSFLKEDKDKFKNYFSFSFVRNPYDRLASAYFFLKNGGRNEYDKKWSDANLVNFHSFKEFIYALKSPLIQKQMNSIIHFHSQSSFVCDEDGKLAVNYIGKFENIEEDFKYVCNKIGVKCTLLHENKTTKKKDYSEYYTIEMKNIVYDVYKNDFELFNYEK